jgi:hypothetical protein
MSSGLTGAPVVAGCSAGLVANTSYSIELLHKKGPYSIVRCAAISNSDANLNQETTRTTRSRYMRLIRLDLTLLARELSYSSERNSSSRSIGNAEAGIIIEVSYRSSHRRLNGIKK